MRWGGICEQKFKREGTCVYLWLIPVDVWQKPTKFCKAIILQLKINAFKWLKKKDLKLPLNIQTIAWMNLAKTFYFFFMLTRKYFIVFLLVVIFLIYIYIFRNGYGFYKCFCFSIVGDDIFCLFLLITLYLISSATF